MRSSLSLNYYYYYYYIRFTAFFPRQHG